ncbi:lysophosphatidylcholine acyltransferase 2 [Lasius niger]|uniref:Lysophosphatidylcholine acyltransferase 2 n=1 Tax=Lasius niger TaxID=67767 RepID=A0A0J7N3M8_LASNI|nr:lysophosphatidylcholine acyltransferase 2 [Lasius niger]
MNGDARNERPNVDEADAASLGADILNPFVHRLELGSTYDKLKIKVKSSHFSERYSTVEAVTISILAYRSYAISAPLFFGTFSYGLLECELNVNVSLVCVNREQGHVSDQYVH